MVQLVEWKGNIPMSRRDPDELREEMLELARHENARARKNWGGSTIGRCESGKNNGSKGGRPQFEEEPPKPKLKLSARANTVNKLLVKDWKVVDIADVLGVSHQAISQIIKRYGLPRTKETG